MALLLIAGGAFLLAIASTALVKLFTRDAYNEIKKMRGW